MAVGRTPSGVAHRCWSITLGLIVVQERLEAIPAQEAISRRARGSAANRLAIGLGRDVPVLDLEVGHAVFFRVHRIVS